MLSLAAYSFIRREKSLVRKVPGSPRCPKSSVRHYSNTMSGQPSSKISLVGTTCFMAVLLVSLLGSGTAQDVANGADSPMIIAGPMANAAAFNGRRIENCQYPTFEIITGRVQQGDDTDTLTTISGSLQLTDCLKECSNNEQCRAINFETGLCVLLNNSAPADAGDVDSTLKPSQFPVFTIYARKVCYQSTRAESKCFGRRWAFERVIGYQLRKYQRKVQTAKNSGECLDLCLSETDFECRSVNYDRSSGQCELSDMDRHTIAENKYREKYFAPSENVTGDYYESNCVREPNKLCDFRASKGRILKTVDSVYQNITTVDECKEKCINSPYRCFSFDFGDPSNPVCRTSHLDKASLSHIEEPYLDITGAVTYELSSCYNVTIVCRAREMIAQVKTSKLFSGKVYAKSKPNSCVNDISNSLDFEITMPFHDVMCDVKQSAPGTFSNDIIIQHHDMIVTTSDLGLSVHCNYDLSNRTVSNVNLEVDGDVEDREGGETYVHSSIVVGPNVTMMITDRSGNDIQAAQVGDPLSLRFEILDKSSPYGIFVSELVAMDGSDTGEITLIDQQGCPTDTTILGPLSQSQGDKQIIVASFDAFKFPTSDIIQFKAIVSPCVSACEPVQCDQTTSLGRRRRRSAGNDTGRIEENESVIVVKTLRIDDNFKSKTGHRQHNHHEIDYQDLGDCYDTKPILMAVSIFVLIQFFVLIVWIRSQNRSSRGSFGDQLYSNFKLPFVAFDNGAFGGGHLHSAAMSTNGGHEHHQRPFDVRSQSHLSSYLPK